MHLTIKTIDLNFQNTPNIIAAYLVPHMKGAVLIECGPGSTRENLQKGLANHGYFIHDVTDVFLTHIHLDHAGAAGWLSNHGANIHVHPIGAPHLQDPTRLLASAARIYGDQMDLLWGETLPVLPEKIIPILDHHIIEVHGVRLTPIETPGHASHHMVFIYDGVCFSGDIGGVRIPGSTAVHAPMPPPEFHLETWRESLIKIRANPISAIAPTHFGIYSDPKWHLTKLSDYLERAERWIRDYLVNNDSQEVLRTAFENWVEEMASQDRLTGQLRQAYELANPSDMSFDGIMRYWRKYRDDA
jgi:glyoxylase-like metal-dependent hydrolase (beta-lactamase superfamily II)